MPSRNRGRLKRRLSQLVGPEALLYDPAGIAAYSYDSSLQSGASAFVVFPESTEQVAEIVKLLHSEKIPFVARGAGTNLSGGSVPLHGGVVLALSRMRRVLEINPAGQYARVQPGVTNLNLQEALKPHGFFFAPDPASQRVSTIGGNVAENSGGPHCLKYGVTTNHILGLKVVAPDGEVLDLGGERLYSPGVDLLGLFVGSEGTLGIATEVICRILPLPRAVRTMLAVYDSTEDASQTVSDIVAAGIVPATLEMMDNLVIRAVEESLHAGIPTDADAVLIIEVDGMEEALGEVVSRIENVCRRNKVRDIKTARDEKERDVLWAGRRGAFGAVARLFPNYLVSDGTVPRTKLPEVLRRVKEIGAKYDLPIGNVFHAGDGNLHPLIFFDARDRNELDRVHHAGKEILIACAKAGGTISGEHGIGTEKIESMSLIFRRHEIQLMRSLKKVLDSWNLCNPGKILPERAIIYDAEIEFPEHSPRLPTKSGDVSGVPVYYPLDSDELADAVVYFCRNEKRYSAIGADTLFSQLPHRKLPDALISIKPLRSIIDYDPENLTVTAEAGVSLEQLQKELRTENQFLPLDAPPQATLGGIISAGLPGVRRNLYGAPRDLVLGLRFMDHFGQTFKAGGKTVKNVAGYDYGKLLAGSWGKLGVITEITLRLLPLPEFRAAFLAGFDQFEAACEIGARMLAAGINPSILTLVNQRNTAPIANAGNISIPPQPYLLLCGAEGNEPAVLKQTVEMKDMACAATAFSEMFEEEVYEKLLGGVTAGCYPASHAGSFLTLCISYPLERAREALNTAVQLEEEFSVICAFAADLASGALFVHLLADENTNPPQGRASRIVETVIRQIPRSSVVVLAHKNRETEPLPFISGGGAPEKWAERISINFHPLDQLNPGLALW